METIGQIIRTQSGHNASLTQQGQSSQTSLQCSFDEHSQAWHKFNGTYGVSELGRYGDVDAIDRAASEIGNRKKMLEQMDSHYGRGASTTWIAAMVSWVWKVKTNREPDMIDLKNTVSAVYTMLKYSTVKEIACYFSWLLSSNYKFYNRVDAGVFKETYNKFRNDILFPRLEKVEAEKKRIEDAAHAKRVEAFSRAIERIKAEHGCNDAEARQIYYKINNL